MPNQLEAVQVPIYRHPNIADEPLDQVNFPYPQLLEIEQLPIVTTHVGGTECAELSSPSPEHGRSYILKLGNLCELAPGADIPPWQDQYGNVFAVVSSKGNNCSKPGIRERSTGGGAMTLNGMLESDSILRVKRASEVLRRAGVDTEWPVLFAQPKLLAFGDDLVTPAIYKQRLFEQEFGDSDELKSDHIEKTIVAVKGLEFFIMLRAMSSGERLAELNKGFHIDHRLFIKTLQLYNTLAPLRRDLLEQLDLPLLIDLPPEEDQEGQAYVSVPRKDPAYEPLVKLYFGKILPRLLGYNVGKLAEAGLKHGYLHAGNIKLFGGIADLDSVRGPALGLGDPENSEAALFSDLKEVLGHAPPFVRKEYTMNLLQQYLRVRGFKPQATQTTPEMSDEVLDLVNHYLMEIPEVLEVVFPGTQQKIEEIKEQDLNHDNFRNNLIKTMANQIADMAMQKLSLIWDYGCSFGNLYDEDEYLHTSRQPSIEELRRGLRFQIDRGFKIEENFDFDRIFRELNLLAQDPAMVSIKDALTASVNEAVLGTKTPVEDDFRVRRIDLAVFDHLMSRVLKEQAISFDEVWPEIVQIFEARLQEKDMDVIPRNQVILNSGTDLEGSEHYWSFDFVNLSRYFPKVPHQLVKPGLHPDLKPNVVKKADDLLCVDFSSHHCIRLLLSDGDFDDYEEIFREDRDSYLRFFKTDAKTGATYALFIMQDEAGHIWAEYNVLRQR